MSSPWPLAGESSLSLARAVSALAPPSKRRFHWEDDLFVLGNEERERGAKTFKYTTTTTGVTTNGASDAAGDHFDEAAQEEACEFVCGMEGCPVVLHSLSAYDAHYQHWHTFKCEVCGLQLPNNRLLEMHLAERHDELFRCMAKTRKMYQCLVEGCSQKSNTRKGRQLHLVAKHSYPPNYTYDRRIRRTPAKTSTRARHKEKPQRVDAEISDSNFSSIGASRIPDALQQLSVHSNGISSGASLPSAGGTAAGGVATTPAPAPAAPRPAVVSRSTILSFMPRSVRSAGAAAATTAVAAAKGAPIAQSLPAYDSQLSSTAAPAPSLFPTASPALALTLTADPSRTGSLFTSMRERSARQDDDDDHGMDDDGTDAAARKLPLRDDDADEDEDGTQDDAAASAGADGSCMADVEAAVGVSRLRVSHTLPNKCSFGSINRRHK